MRRQEREGEERVDGTSATGAGAEATGTPERGRGRASGMRSIWVMFGLALLIHLIPLFLPRNTAEAQLAVARTAASVEQRLPYVLPLKEHPKATAAELREAAELVMYGAPAEARELAREAERREPRAVETQLLLARICELERMERCVSASLERAEQVAPEDARPHLLRAELREKDGDVVGAAEAAGRAWVKAPKDPLIALRYVGLLSEARQGDEALAVLAKLEGQVPHARLLVERGRVSTRSGQDADAVKLFRKAVAEDPRLAMGYFELGLAWYRLGNLDAAEDALRQADRLDPGDAKSLAALCAMQLKEGRIDGARLTRMDLERRFSGQDELIRRSCSIP